MLIVHPPQLISNAQPYESNHDITDAHEFCFASFMHESRASLKIMNLLVMRVLQLWILKMQVLKVQAY